MDTAEPWYPIPADEPRRFTDWQLDEEDFDRLIAEHDEEGEL